jgi:hypothetical protein
MPVLSKSLALTKYMLNKEMIIDLEASNSWFSLPLSNAKDQIKKFKILVIPASREAEIRRIEVRSQVGQIF